MEAEGVRFQAQFLEDGSLASAEFGFDMRNAGLLPVRIGIANQSGNAVRLIPRQTFLVDLDNQAWPMLTSVEASERLARAGIKADSPPRTPQREDMDALTGFALDMAVGPAVAIDATAAGKADNTLSRTFVGKHQHNRNIPAGQQASGTMLFPGQEEARGVRGLRLCYQQDGREKYLFLWRRF
jgi:hypothetical protein